MREPERAAATHALRRSRMDVRRTHALSLAARKLLRGHISSDDEDQPPANSHASQPPEQTSQGPVESRPSEAADLEDAEGNGPDREPVGSDGSVQQPMSPVDPDSFREAAPLSRDSPPAAAGVPVDVGPDAYQGSGRIIAAAAVQSPPDDGKLGETPSHDAREPVEGGPNSPSAAEYDGGECQDPLAALPDVPSRPTQGLFISDSDPEDASEISRVSAAENGSLQCQLGQGGADAGRAILLEQSQGTPSGQRGSAVGVATIPDSQSNDEHSVGEPSSGGEHDARASESLRPYCSRDPNGSLLQQGSRSSAPMYGGKDARSLSVSAVHQPESAAAPGGAHEGAKQKVVSPWQSPSQNAAVPDEAEIQLANELAAVNSVPVEGGTADTGLASGVHPDSQSPGGSIAGCMPGSSKKVTFREGAQQKQSEVEAPDAAVSSAEAPPGGTRPAQKDIVTTECSEDDASGHTAGQSALLHPLTDGKLEPSGEVEVSNAQPVHHRSSSSVEQAVNAGASQAHSGDARSRPGSEDGHVVHIGGLETSGGMGQSPAGTPAAEKGAAVSESEAPSMEQQAHQRTPLSGLVSPAAVEDEIPGSQPGSGLFVFRPRSKPPSQAGTLALASVKVAYPKGTSQSQPMLQRTQALALFPATQFADSTL